MRQSALPSASRPAASEVAWLRAEAVALLAALLTAGGAVLLAGWLSPPEPGTLLPSGERLFTPEQLRPFDGAGGRRIYLAILGSVYDVTPGAKHYGPKGGYRIFAGRDASRSYVTGKFKEDLNDDVEDFDDEQLSELASWRSFYVDHKEYKAVGKVVGRFYDAAGQPTALLARAEAAAAAAAAAKEAAEGGGQAGGGQQAQQPCNVKWSKSEGGSVWCEEGRFPRRVLQPDWQGQPQEHNAVVTSAQQRSSGDWGGNNPERGEPQPGDCMPDDLVVPTLDGNLTVPRDGSANTPLLAMGLDPADPFSTAMWVAPASLDALLLRAPEGAHFLFFSHSNDSAETDAQWMRQRLLSRAHVLQLPSDQLDQLLQRLHFATQPPAAMGGWLPQLLEQWQMPRRIAAEAAGATAVLLAAPAGRFPREANCSCPEECGAELSIPASMVPHSIGVVLRDVLRAGDRVNVSFEEEQGPGLWAGIDASGSLIELGWPKVASLLHGVWAAQYQAYLQGLQERLAAPAHVIPIFKGDKAFEDTGRPLRKSVTLPNWSKLAGKDQVELDMQLSCAGTTDADCPTYDHVIQLFVCCGTADGMLPPCEPCQPTVWAGSSGSAGGSGSSSSGGDSSSSGGSGMSLPLLPGAAAARHNGSTRALAAAWQEQPALVQGQSNGQKCGRELGRWITPFRRRVGRWLTDVSALRPLLLPAPRLLRMQCTFTLQAPAWAGPWQPTLSLRFSSGPTEVMQMADGAAVDDGSGGSSYGGSSSSMERQAAAATAGSVPANPQQQAPLQRQPQQQRCSQSAAAQHVQRVLPLPFSGGDFGPGYNNRTAAGYNFTTPPGLRRALLVARITGHGWGPETDGCADFCGTQHSFWVNGAAHEFGMRFERAGALWACADQVPNGVVPNQHGTFLYGRNGWCPGQDVAPWVADVTAALSPLGQLNSIAYCGALVNGSEPRGSKHSGPDAIRVSEALSGESTQEVGSDATNMASAMDSVPAVAADPQGDALRSVMRQDEGDTTGAGGDNGGSSGLKPVTLRTAPQDARFPTTNQQASL
ncbi:Peptide-N(4)-(N-acetyl-beta-D-glucosaminyl)a sparagine amidase F [Chlorella sorokiniana]|uniref:Peptide-N(4)-(N-acetyl-beta-D-glucosaminyl)a sparagine amidase F n=1 Tax=Chlorella sorokiniana TaxID=3076 RepID=A0A2P6TEL6_CHLSO|nr:Peptide-N(4)-(N-acetyl-beta-D-glucosaminyl)a sparagine amidase F [Chlorella sorokiniana]|eukprot:PRW21088.1 Peptide-N(4)-(N-acetyl-beta-D-glucosaminyl)a sparagine amidase F [Chlorella sorokiniana]